MRELFLIAALSLSACQRTPEAPPRVKEPVVEPKSVETGEMGSLDTYSAFSQDGLLFAWTQKSEGAGLFVTSFLASTTNTIEKTVPLEDDATRRAVLKELAEEGFPTPGKALVLPREVGVTVSDGLVQVMFGGMPAAKPWRPFAGMDDISPVEAAVVAVSNDGQWVAVRVTGSNFGEFGPPVEHHVVALFQ